MSDIPQHILTFLAEPYTLSDTQIASFRQNGYVKLKAVFNADTIGYFNSVISQKVAEMTPVTSTLEERDTYGKAFLQLFNLWRQDANIKELVFSKRLAKIAADLMEIDGVRLYHDQALFK